MNFIRWLSKFFLAAFLLLIPTQFGKHFWPDWSYVLGVRVDYLSPTLYFLDLIWLGLFLSEIKCIPIKIKENFNFKTFICLLFVGVNILIATNKWLCLYKWLRLGQIIWSIWYFKSKKIEIKEVLVKAVPIWIIFESILGVSQIFKGGSLNGILYLLGERSFSFNTVGIAQMSIAGFGLVRAYGTFSHPNSLAGFLMVSLLIWIWIKIKVNNKVWWWMVFWLAILGLIISGSRIIWVLGILIWLVSLWLNNRNKKTVGIGVVVAGIFILVVALITTNYPIGNFIGGWDKESFTKRMNLNLVAINIIKDNFWLGKGLGNFLNILPDYQKNNGIFWMQPVHNVFLLLLSEVGVLGLVILGVLTSKLIKRKRIEKNEMFIFGIILITSLWDHYWITLPQNLWLLTVVLAII